MFSKNNWVLDEYPKSTVFMSPVNSALGQHLYLLTEQMQKAATGS
jgi:hypothetical protein